MIYKAKASSNIAFLKYWGKEKNLDQIPLNNSISMTLSSCFTETECSISEKIEHEIILNNKKLSKESKNYPKIINFLNKLQSILNEPKKLTLKTSNNFPTGSGIASSASGFAALTIAAIACWKNCKNFKELSKKNFSKKKLADLARLGSGSACRSFYGGFALWEKPNKVSSLFSKNHWNLWNTIIIFSIPNQEKLIFSSDGHKVAESSPFFKIRLSGLPEKESLFIKALKSKNIKLLGPLLEQEALELHSVMTTSSPSIKYITEEVESFLCWIRKIRLMHNLQIYFTLDAGPNIHLIGKKKDQQRLWALLKTDYPTINYIIDSIGTGPTLSVI
jgi:diphosphomevalonate decarboxylase